MVDSNFQESPDMFLGSSMEWEQLEEDSEETRVTNMTPRTETWRGVPLTEIYGGSTPWESPEFPPIAPSYNHAVLFHISQSVATGVTSKPPTPQKGKDKWDKHSVRMPCSSQSLYPVEEEDGSTNLRQRWLMIEEALSQPICSSKELESAILSYNTKFKNQWKFKALHKLFDEYLEEEESKYFFNVTVPAMTKLALRLPELIQSPIPLLRQYKNRSVSLSQQQISCLLANAFFCTFPRRNTNKTNSEYSSYPDINFYRLYQSSNSTAVLEKLKCLCHYFRRVTTRVPCGVLTFSRRSIEASKCPNWAKSDVLAGAAPLHVDSSGTIEDEGLGLIQIDFANKYLGGGVLGYGCVQEEIRFVICPELLVSTLFTEMLRPTEALLMIGCERYSMYSGYAHSFQWAGDFEDGTPHDTSSRRRCAVLAIDALQFSNANQQYRPELITRELNKAWVGFSVFSDGCDGGLQYPGVGSGNWGCGAFGGSPALKSLLQVMACSQARRPLAYFTFGDVDLRNNIINIYNFISQNNITVGKLFEYLTAFYKSNVSKDELYSFLLQHHRDVTDTPPQTHSKETWLTTLPHMKDELKNSSTESAICEQKLTKSLEKNSTNKLLSEKDIENSFVEDEVPFVDLEKGEAEVPEASDKHKIISDKAKTPVKFKSKLFDEMTDYDETNSQLNLNNGSPLKYKTLSFLENETQSKVCQEKIVERREEIIEEGPESLSGILPENCDEVRSPKIPKVNPPTPTKKIARKITDYFLKKH